MLEHEVLGEDWEVREDEVLDDVEDDELEELLDEVLQDDERLVE